MKNGIWYVLYTLLIFLALAVVGRRDVKAQSPTTVYIDGGDILGSKSVQIRGTQVVGFSCFSSTMSNGVSFDHCFIASTK
jgi:hypothetical protein